MRILYDSKKEYFKKPFGCLKTDEKCEIKIKIPKNCETLKCYIMIEGTDGFLMQLPMKLKDTDQNYEVYETYFCISHCGLYRYYFKIETKMSAFNLYKYASRDTNIADGAKWQFTCYDKNYTTPDEFKGRVYYQIFPDRFFEGEKSNLEGKLEPYWIHNDKNDNPNYLPDEKGEILNNDFFGGNLDGIIKKMDYIKDIGVGVIYLNPIFYAFSNHRYDAAYYKKIDPMLGDDLIFKKLCDTAHKNNIKIIIDCAFSHTGSNSIYFDKKSVFGSGAYSDNNSPYRDWYSFSEYPQKYTSWWGIDTLPCVNELNEGFLNHIIFDDDSVVNKWINLGADGIRLDVADELPDEFIMHLKKKLKQIKPDALLMGEVWEDASNKESYGVLRKYFSHSELDSVMNYPYQNAIINFANENISGHNFSDIIMTIAENYPKEVLDCVMTSLSTHDTLRILNALMPEICHLSKDEKAHHKMSEAEYKKAVKKEKMCALLQFTLPGSPCIYYGDEAGQEGFEDPFNRRFYPWGKEDLSLIEFYKNLADIKNKIKAFKTGKIDFLFENGKNFGFIREEDGEKYIVVASCDESFCYECKKEDIVLLHNADYNEGKLKLSKYGAAIIKA